MYGFIKNQRGVITPLLLASIGIIAFFIIASTISFNNGIFSYIFNKPSSFAAGSVELSMQPSQATVAQNDTFTIDINMDAKTQQVTAASVLVNFDPIRVQAISVQKGSFLPVSLTNEATSSGTVSFDYGANPGTPASGTGTLATVTFKALTTTIVPSQINFDSTQTQVAAIGSSENQVGSLLGSNITIQTTAANQTASLVLNPTTINTNTNVIFPVKVNAKTDVEGANFFSAKLKFDPTKLQVDHIDTTGTFIQLWVVDPLTNFNNSTGTVNLAGGIPTPGYKTNGQPETIATVYFKGIAPGSSIIDFDGSSAIYSDAQNINILGTTSPATITTTGVVPTPTPTMTPTPTPSASPTITPTLTPSPTPTPPPLGCTLNQVEWVLTSGQVNAGDPVQITITGTGACAGKQVALIVKQDNGIFGETDVRIQPSTVTFGSSNTITATWIAEFQVDGPFGINNPPEYFVSASLVGGNFTVTSNKAQELTVYQLSEGNYAKGDFNKNIVIDVQDISIFLRHLGKSKTSNPDEYSELIDIGPINAPDGIINAIDWSVMVQIILAVNLF